MMEIDSAGDKARRRKRPRLRVGIPARLRTLGGRLEVRLIDISQSGARIELRSTERPCSAMLEWLSFEAFGDIVWIKDGLLGMKFDPLLPADHILQTRELAPSVVADTDPLHAAAKAFAQGDNRWR